MLKGLTSMLKKSINWDITWNSWDWQNFYPLTNTQFNVRTLNRTDYLNLYTSWVYSAVNAIANSTADLDFILKRNKNSTDNIDHEYLNLITPDLLIQIVSFLQLNGSAYVYMSKFWNRVDSLHVLRPDILQIEYYEDWRVKHYRYSVWNSNYIYQPDEIMAFNLFNPLEKYPYVTKGVSPMQAVAIEMNSDIASQTWNWNFFKNNWSVKEILSSEWDLTPESAQRIESKWNNAHQWVNNAHKLAILPNGLKYQSVWASQREMDFVEWQRFNRDKILAIFQVPKSILWLWESVNVWNVTAFDRVFAQRVVQPLSTKIAGVLNKQLFNWIWTFEFINVVPIDKDELRADFDAWAITINEYRQSIWKKPLVEWDVLKINVMATSDDVTIEEEPKKWLPQEQKEKISSILTKWLDKEAKAQANWEKKILRNNTYEAKYIEKINEIFTLQEQDILKQLSWQKNIKAKLPNFSITKYLPLWQIAIWPLQKEVVQNEWNQALQEVWATWLFQTWTPSVNKFLRDNINKFAKEVDKFTKEKIFDIIARWNEEWLSAIDISINISKTFEGFKKNRSKTIARTETIRAWTYATNEAWIESDVVEAKEWFTALDERVCSNCWPMHGKIVKLKDNFFNKWQTAPWGLKLDYENVEWPPLHPNCRCTLIPIIK